MTTINPNNYGSSELARKLKLPGMVVTAHIDPKALTVRVRNAAIRMIESGLISGYGGAAKLAKTMLAGSGAPYINGNLMHHSYVTVLNARDVPQRVREELDEACAADRALRIMELTSGIAGNANHWQQRELELLKDDASWRDVLRIETVRERIFVTARSKGAAALYTPIIEAYLAQYKDARKPYADPLRGDGLIPVSLDTNS